MTPREDQGASALPVSSVETLHQLIDRIRDYAIFLLDPEGRVATWNAGARQIKGYDADEIIGQSFSRFYTPEDQARGLPQKMLALAASDGRAEYEGWRVRKDGSRFWAHLILTALRGDNGELIGFGKVTRDLTERRRADLALSQLAGRLLSVEDRERDRIGRDLHDRTSPMLTALTTRLYNALYAVKPPESISEYKVILDECLRTVEDLAGVVRSTARLLHPPLLDERGLLASLRWYLKEFQADSGIRVDARLPATLPDIPQEGAVAMFRVAQEALNNVARHSGDRAAELNVAADDGAVTLLVRDRGRGLPNGVLGHLESGTSETGIGIAGMIARMRQVGGTVTVSSKTGVTVRATLPLPAEEE